MKAWMLLLYGPDQVYGGNSGYADDAYLSYSYDNFVPNSRQLATGDIVVLVGKHQVIGTAVVSIITQSAGSKERRRCPVCGIAQSKRRTRATPLYRCNKGHEFDTPLVDQVECQQFVAKYDGTFAAWPDVTVQDIRNVCVSYHSQLSIQPLDSERFHHLLIRTRHRPDLGKLLPARTRCFWSGICNPDRYRFDEAYAAVDETTWAIPRGDVRAGDGLLIWMAAGAKRQPRGVVAFATVLTDPEAMMEPAALQQYWQNSAGSETLRRAWIRYERLPNVPLLLGGPHDAQLLDLKVSRSQGNGVFTVSESQWRQVWQLAAGSSPLPAPITVNHSELYDFSDVEGRRRLMLHYRIERSRQLVLRKKAIVLQRTGQLACECCGFDFANTYGPQGGGVCECHHVHPLHTLLQETISTLEDVAIVCANCHRMLHHIPDCTPQTLREILTNTASERSHAATRELFSVGGQ
jgi:predicted HNH restriction endonuclease